MTNFDGRYMFYTIFHEDSKNITFFKIGHTQSTPKLCPAWLLIKTEQASQAELGRRLGVSNLEKNYIFGILMKNCTKYVSPSQIRRNVFQSGHPYGQVFILPGDTLLHQTWNAYFKAIWQNFNKQQSYHSLLIMHQISDTILQSIKTLHIAVMEVLECTLKSASAASMLLLLLPSEIKRMRGRDSNL